MVWVPGGEFLMGSEDFYPEEPDHAEPVPPSRRLGGSAASDGVVRR
jgi:formylglycine-generating enzyme required for sulfatase activity